MGFYLVNPLNESARQSRKRDIPCPYLLRRGWCIKLNRCDYSHENISRQTCVTPKSEVPCLFLKNRGYYLKETSCDFLHPIKRKPSTQPTIMFPHTPTYQHVPLFQSHMRRDTRSQRQGHIDKKTFVPKILLTNTMSLTPKIDEVSFYENSYRRCCLYHRIMASRINWRIVCLNCWIQFHLRKP